MADLQLLINEKQSEILAHKAYLKATDYKVIKKYEGYEIDEDILSARAQTRSDINALELEIREIEQELIESEAEMQNIELNQL